MHLTKDIGRILENIVAGALLSENDLYYYSGKKECDFVAIDKNNNIQLFQVCADLNNENLKRETDGLAECMDYFNLKQGTILTSSQEEEIVNGDKKINIIPIWKWLLINT